VAEEEPVDPDDPEVCAPQDDVYAFYETVSVDRVRGYTYTIPAPGVLANDGACEGIDTFLQGDASNLASFELNADGSIEVIFTDAPAYVEFSYTTTNGQTASGQVELFEAIDPIVCANLLDGAVEICVQGDTFTFTRIGQMYTSVGALDTYATPTLCLAAAIDLAGTSFIRVNHGLLSEFGDVFAGDDRTFCAYGPVEG
jgi:hypothetical protein